MIILKRAVLDGKMSPHGLAQLASGVSDLLHRPLQAIDRVNDGLWKRSSIFASGTMVGINSNLKRYLELGKYHFRALAAKYQAVHEIKTGYPPPTPRSYVFRSPGVAVTFLRRSVRVLDKEVSDGDSSQPFGSEVLQWETKLKPEEEAIRSFLTMYHSSAPPF